MSESGVAPVYVFDTSVFINGWRRHYPYPAFNDMLWMPLAHWIHAGRIVVPIEVVLEIEEQDDEITRWCTDWKSAAKPEMQEIKDDVHALLARYPSWVRVQGTRMRSQADPFVVVWARKLGIATVTYEGKATKRNPVTIPSVCEDLKIPCLSFSKVLADTKLFQAP